jgi:hypothetical protein
MVTGLEYDHVIIADIADHVEVHDLYVALTQGSQDHHHPGHPLGHQPSAVAQRPKDRRGRSTPRPVVSPANRLDTAAHRGTRRSSPT